jgi:hypothetical protein
MVSPDIIDRADGRQLPEQAERLGTVGNALVQQIAGNDDDLRLLLSDQVNQSAVIAAKKRPVQIRKLHDPRVRYSGKFVPADGQMVVVIDEQGDKDRCQRNKPVFHDSIIMAGRRFGKSPFFGQSGLLPRY